MIWRIINTCNYWWSWLMKTAGYNYPLYDNLVSPQLRHWLTSNFRLIQSTYWNTHAIKLRHSPTDNHTKWSHFATFPRKKGATFCILETILSKLNKRLWGLPTGELWLWDKQLQTVWPPSLPLPLSAPLSLHTSWGSDKLCCLERSGNYSS